MTDHKEPRPAPGYAEQREQSTSERRNGKDGLTARRGNALVSSDGRDVSGWDAYRRWLSRAQLPDKRRIAMDPSLYTWKGYRTWAEKVRRDWRSEE